MDEHKKNLKEYYEYDVFPYDEYNKNLIGKFMPGLYVMDNNGKYRTAYNDEIETEKTIALKDKKNFYETNGMVLLRAG